MFKNNNVLYGEQLKYVILRVIEKAGEQQSADMIEIKLEKNRGLWDPNNSKDFKTTISGAISELVNNHKALYENDKYFYDKEVYFYNVIEDLAENIIDFLEIDIDDQAIEWRNDNKKNILTPEDIVELVNVYYEQ